MFAGRADLSDYGDPQNRTDAHEAEPWREEGFGRETGPPPAREATEREVLAVVGWKDAADASDADRKEGR
jgi:hypothetical protein